MGTPSLLQIRASVVTNWGSYYKLGQPLLQNWAAITNWGKMYYKLGQVLQIMAIITNWGITHTHAPDPEEVLVEKSRSAIKCAAIETNASTNNIIAANIAGGTDNVLAKLPRMETMCRDVRRQRATHAAYQRVSDDSATLFDIPQRFTVTSTEDEFLKYHNQRVDRILIFGTGRSFCRMVTPGLWTGRS